MRGEEQVVLEAIPDGSENAIEICAIASNDW
jgi:hypothetical protein